MLKTAVSNHLKNKGMASGSKNMVSGTITAGQKKKTRNERFVNIIALGLGWLKYRKKNVIRKKFIPTHSIGSQRAKKSD